MYAHLGGLKLPCPTTMPTRLGCATDALKIRLCFFLEARNPLLRSPLEAREREE